MDENIIVIENLNKFYGKKHAINDLSLTIEKGMFGLLGRNGAGKTTLMKILATLLNKKSGDVQICGVPIKNASEVRKLIGYLPQEFSIYPSMRVEDAMDYLGILSGMPKAMRREKISLLLEEVNLTEHINKKVKSLSGGMKRRLGIAQALLHDPKVLIVDEPTAGLDPEERIRFRNLLCEVAENKIVILSTHIVGDIESTCENIAILNEGSLLYKGTINDLVQCANGNIYKAMVSSENLKLIKEKYIVTNMLTKGECFSIRFISNDTPEVKADLCEPAVEEAYMNCLLLNGVEKRNLGGEL